MLESIINYLYYYGIQAMALLPFIGVAVLGLTMSYFVIVGGNRVSTVWKFLLPSIMVVFILMHVAWINSIRGFPVHDYPNGKFQYLAHRVIMDHGKREIELWIVTEHGFSRLYVIPWSDSNSKQLDLMKKKSQSGGKPTGKFKRPPRGGSQYGDLQGGEPDIHITLPTPTNPKDDNGLGDIQQQPQIPGVPNRGQGSSS